MNWLAHVALSPREPVFQLGNLFADLVPMREEAQYPAAFQQGCVCHRAIDAFTDSHPLVYEAKAYVGDGFLRYAGVVVDIYFDHLLATHWDTFYAEPLPATTAHFYRSATPVLTNWAQLSPAARTTWGRIVEHDVLGSMGRIESVAFALDRISQRWQNRFKRTIDLHIALKNLEANRAAVTARFMGFYPALQATSATFHL